MNMKPYNGHTNYETWLMATWLRNDYELAEMVSEAERDPHKLASMLRDKGMSDMPDLNGVWAGFLISAFSEVDWVGVAEYFVKNSEAVTQE